MKREKRRGKKTKEKCKKKRKKKENLEKKWEKRKIIIYFFRNYDSQFRLTIEDDRYIE
jgi:hypothetical protein